MIKEKLRLTSVFAMLILGSSAIAANSDREQRLAEQTLQTLFVGEELWLKHPHGTFLALYEQGKSKKPSFLLIHGTGQGPDTTVVIGPLRTTLSDYGFTTLSLQMPVLSEEAKYPDYLAEFPNSAQRISAGVQHLISAEDTPIVIIAHSMGASMLMNWLSKTSVGDEVQSIFTLGLGATQLEQEKQAWTQIDRPWFDIYGENDYKPVLEGALERLKKVKASHSTSQQIMVDNADHFFTDQQAELAERIIELTR